MTINDRLFAVMKEQSVGIRELSRRTGITASTISDWNTKHTNPSSDKISIICEALNISTSFLLTGKEENRFSDFAISDSEKYLIEMYRSFDSKRQARLLSYIEKMEGKRL